MTLINRRKLIGAVATGAGAYLLAPMARGLVAEATGATPRKRFILFTSSNGFPRMHYAQTARSETDFDLNAVMQPFAPWKRELTILHPLSCPFDVCLHGNNFGGLTNTQAPNPKNGAVDIFYTPGGPTIDRFIARKIGGDDPFSSLFLGPAYTSGGGSPTGCCADGTAKSWSGYAHPMKAHEAIFRGRAMAPVSGPDSATLLAQNRSALDAIRADVSRLSAALAGPERARMDQYLESLRALERQLTPSAAAGPCRADVPKSVSSSGLSRENVAGLAEIGIAALRCGLTHILHLTILGLGGPQIPYSWINGVTEHNCHHGNIKSALDAQALFKHNTWATVWSAMRATPEGNGTMADSAVAVYFNVCGGAHHNGSKTMPAVILGNAGGALRAGRNLELPAGKYATGHLWVSIANALGVQTDTFGSAAHSKGGLPELS